MSDAPELPARSRVPRAAGLLSYRNLVLALVLATFALRLWSVSRWSWNSDDWIYMHDASFEPLLAFVFQNYNGHFMPGQFLVVWVLNAVAPLDHSVVAVVTAAWAAALAGLWAVALRHLSGTGAVTWSMLLLLTLTPLQIHPTMWWAAALQTLALQTCLAACLYFAARLVDSGGESGGRGLVVSYVLGLVMWEKALFLLLPVVVVLLHRTSGPVLEVLKRYRGVLTWLAGVSAAYLVVFLAAVRLSGPPTANAVRPDPVRSFGDIAGFYYDLWAHLLAPGLLGGPWATLPTPVEFDAHPGVVVQVATVAVLAGLATWLMIRDRRAWMPVAAAVLYAAVAWGTILFSSRFDTVSWHRLGYERYAIDAFVVLVVMLGLAATRTGAGREGSDGGGRRRLVSVGVVLALAASLGVASTLSVLRFGVSPTRPWLAALERGTERDAGVHLVDRHAPDEVMPATFWGDRALLSYLLAPWGDRVRFQGPAPELHLVDEEGRVRRAAFQESSRSVPGPDPDCGYAVTADEPRTVEMESELFDFEWVLKVDGYAASAETLLVRGGGEDEIEVPIPAGLSSHQVVVTGEAERFELQMSEDSGTACITTLSVGTVAPGQQVLP